MIRFLLLFCLLLLGTSCSTFDKNDNAHRAALHLQLGTSHLATGNYPGAMTELLRAEKLDPENPIVQNNLGLAYYVRNRFVEAEKHCRRAVELKSDYTEARNNLGRVLVELKKYDEAIRELKISVNDLTFVSPEKSYASLGLAYLKKNDFAQAQFNLAKSLEIQKQSCQNMTYYGQSLLGLKKYDSAAEAFDQAITICKTDKFDEPYYLSGLSYMRARQPERAIARLEEMMQLFPKSAYVAKAQTLLEILK